MKLKKSLALFAISASFIFTMPADKSYAASYLVSYNGITQDKENSTVSYYLNNDKINSNYPGIIMDNGVSVASANDIFVKSGMGITYKYSSKYKKLILYHDRDRISFTLGKNYAYVNGVKKTIGCPATLIKFPNGTSKICVPARFVASTFGYSYNYYSDTDKVVISGAVNDSTKLKYNGKTYGYTGSRLLCSVNGNNVNSEENPAVYIFQTLMAPAKYVFSQAELGTKYSYNKSKKTVTLTCDKKKLVMTLGSKKAKLGNKTVTLSQAPILVNYVDSKKNNILVPVEEVSSYLGLSTGVKGNICTIVYPKKNTGSSTTASSPAIDTKPSENATQSAIDSPTSETTTQTAIDQKPGESNSGDNIITTPDGSLFTLVPSVAGGNYIAEANAGMPGNYELTGLTSTDGTTAYSSLDDVSQLESSNVNGLYDTYTFTSSSGFYGVSGSFVSGSINIRLSNMISNDSVKYFDGGIADSALISYDASTMTSTVKFNTKDISGYNCYLSADAKTLTVKIYTNGLTGIYGEYKNGSAYINLAGIKGVSVTDVSSNNSSLSFTVHNVADTIGEQNYHISDSYGLVKSVSYKANGDGTAQVNIEKSATNQYYVTASGNITSIVIMPDTGNIELSPNNIIPLPDGVTESDISDVDDEYSNKKFTIYINGDHTAFYNSNTIEHSSAVSSVNVSLTNNGKTAITFNTHKLQAYKIKYGTGKLSLQIGNPQDVYSKIVVLDAGHGGKDNGTSHGSTLEKDLNLTILHDCMEEVRNDPNLKIYYTREDDTFIELKDRAAYASKVGADFFISLHMNSATSSAKGTEVWYSKTNNDPTSSGLTSYKLAQTLCENLTSKLGNYNRGVKNNIFVVTKTNTVPAVLIELGFVSNSSDLKKLKDPDYRLNAAQVIYDSIEQIFNEYPTGR